METSKELLNEEFFSAIKAGDEERVLIALDSGADINHLTTSGNNALFLAGDRRKLGVFQILLDYVSPSGEKINIDNQNNLGTTALLEFVKTGNFTKYVEKLIEYKANVNLPDNNGLTALIKASGDNKEDEIDLLLSASNIDVNYTIRGTKTTAFLMACTHADINIAKKLKDAGADIDVLDDQGKNALLNALFKSTSNMNKIEKEKHKELCIFLVNCCNNLDYVAPSGMTAFWVASITRQKEICDLLLEKKVNVDVWHELGLDGKMSAFHLWCQSGTPEMVDLLYKAGGKFGIPDSKGNTADAYGFMRAALRSKMLELNADVNAIFYTEDNKIPVFSAVVSSGDKQIEIVKEMINRGAKVSYSKEEDKKFEPLFIAIASSAKIITEELLKNKNIDLNQLIKFSSDSEELTAIGFLFNGSTHKGFSAKLEQKKYYESILKAKEINDKNGIVSDRITKEELEDIKKELEEINKISDDLENNKINILQQLLKNGAKLNLENNDGNTEIFFANKPEYIDLLIGKGSNLFHKNKLDNDVLYESVLRGRSPLIAYLKQQFENNNNKTIDNLFYKLAFEDVKNYIKQESIEKGIYSYIDRKNNEEVKKAFAKPVEGEEPIKLNIKGINYQDEDGNSPLLVACANGNGFLIGLYLKLGADINLKNNNDETAIMHALSNDNVEMIKFLIKNGADINVVNKAGTSLWEMAQELGNKTIIEELRIAFNTEPNEKKKITI